MPEIFKFVPTEEAFVGIKAEASVTAVLLFWSGFSRMRGGVAVIAVVYTGDYGRESLGGLNGSK